MTGRAIRSRRLLLCLIVVLGIGGGALVTVYAIRRPAPAGTGWSEISPSDQRVSRVFATLERNGLTAALDSLERRAASDSVVLRGAHQLAHALGRQALMSSGGDASIIGQCRPAFGSGCYHGVVEALLKFRGRIDMAGLEQMCAAAGSKEAPGAPYECAHGLGHGVLGAEGLDVGTALRHCDGVGRPSFVTSCHEGVFMEAITSGLARNEDHGSHLHGPEGHAGMAARITIDPGNPYSPCDRFADPYANSCWLFQGFVILRAAGFDPAKALGICNAAPDGRADRCYESVGFQLTGLFQRSDAWVIEQCGKGDPELAATCASGAALALASMDWSGQRVTGYCEAVPSAWSESCYTTAASMLVLVSSPAQKPRFAEPVSPGTPESAPRQ